jgi:DNA polymerase III delta prime subunit
MTAILICSRSKKTREAALLELADDRGEERESLPLTLGEGEEKIRLSEVKRFLPHLYIKSAKGVRTVLIPEAHRLTIASQNAFLKSLEEPPPNTLFLLTTPHRRMLLPTIVSRCRVIQKEAAPTGEERKKEVALAKKIIKAERGKRLTLFEEKVSYQKEEINKFLEGVEILLKSSLNQASAQILTRVWGAKKLLRNESANPKIIVDDLLLSW